MTLIGFCRMYKMVKMHMQIFKVTIFPMNANTAGNQYDKFQEQ